MQECLGIICFGVSVLLRGLLLLLISKCVGHLCLCEYKYCVAICRLVLILQRILFMSMGAVFLRSSLRRFILP